MAKIERVALTNMQRVKWDDLVRPVGLPSQIPSSRVHVVRQDSVVLDHGDTRQIVPWFEFNENWIILPQEKKQVGGEHYAKHTIQPWDIIKEYNLGFFEGNVIKYILRAPDKNGIEDLEKALHYLEEFLKIKKAESDD